MTKPRDKKHSDAHHTVCILYNVRFINILLFWEQEVSLPSLEELRNVMVESTHNTKTISEIPF